jgi:plastocyanin
MRFAFLLGLTLARAALGADLDAVVKNDRGAPVAEAVVIAVPDIAPPKPARIKVEQVEQIDQEFVPRVKPVLVGSAVSFPNHDTVRHHVYSFSPAKRFDLPLYVGTPANPVVFDTAGVVTIGCNIHDWMVGYIYVSESPYYATTDARGTARLAGLPPGAYTVRVWHPQLAVPEGSTRQRVELTGTAQVEWKLSLKPEVRIRRAPAPRGSGRY